MNYKWYFITTWENIKRKLKVPKRQVHKRWVPYPVWTWVKVLRVYDGDTFYIDHKINGKHYEYSVRLYGIDTPEIRPKKFITMDDGTKVPRTIEDINNEKEEALKAKTFVETWFEQSKNWIQVCSVENDDKFGRLLLRVRNHQHVELANILVEHGLGVSYFGKKKDGFSTAL